MTDDELQAIEERYSATTPGDWIADIQPFNQFDLVKALGEGVFYNTVAQTKNLGHTSADAFFIASAHQDVPKLVAEVWWLRAEMLEGCIVKVSREDHAIAKSQVGSE